MSGISRTMVEDAVVAALEARLGTQVKTVRSYQGNWRTDLRQESWRLPAALVMLTGSDAEQVGLSSYDLTLEEANRILESTPKSADAWLLLSDAHLARGEADKAQAAATEVYDCPACCAASVAAGGDEG